MLSVLTAGCLLGAVALFGISLQGTFTSAQWTPYIWAHANSQLYGWVGFFIIGFSLQQHAPRQSKLSQFRWMSVTTLALMAVAIGMRFVAEPMSRVQPDLWVPIGVFCCLLQAVAVMLFVSTIMTTRHKSGAGLTWQSLFIFASLFWFLAIALIEPFVFFRTHGPGPQQFVAEWFAVYREAQFLGFVAQMIFGVALTKLSSCFGIQPANRTLGLIGFALWNVGLIVRFAGWRVLFESGFQNGAVYGLGALMLSTAAAAIVLSSNIFSAAREPHRSQRFVRASFAWLLVGGLMQVAMPLHLSLAGVAFSHAYVGALAHVVTVGFISQMIIGFSLHVTARMNDIDDAKLSPLWSVFWLLNVGNAARVGFEIATDYSSAAFLPMGVTGFIELCALGIWAYSIVSMMKSRQRAFA
jgi:hypothetical protein